MVDRVTLNYPVVGSFPTPLAKFKYELDKITYYDLKGIMGV